MRLISVDCVNLAVHENQSPFNCRPVHCSNQPTQSELIRGTALTLRRRFLTDYIVLQDESFNCERFFSSSVVNKLRDTTTLAYIVGAGTYSNLKLAILSD